MDPQAGEGSDPERLELAASLLSSGESLFGILMGHEAEGFTQKEIRTAARVYGLHLPKAKPAEKEAFEKWKEGRREREVAERITNVQRRAANRTVKGVEAGAARKQRDMAFDVGTQLATEWEEIRKSCLSEWRRTAQDSGKPLKGWLVECVEGWTELAPAHEELRTTLMALAAKNEELTKALNAVLDRRNAVHGLVRLITEGAGRPLNCEEFHQAIEELSALVEAGGSAAPVELTVGPQQEQVRDEGSG